VDHARVTRADEGGRARTRAEYDELLIRSGFTTGELKRVDTDSNVLAAGPGA